MPNVSEIIKDPNFLQLPDAEKTKVMQSVDENFMALPPEEQSKVVMSFGAGIQDEKMPIDTSIAPNEHMVAHDSFGKYNIPDIMQSVHERYGAGQLKPQHINAYDELKRRGVFDKPFMNVASLKGAQPEQTEEGRAQKMEGMREIVDIGKESMSNIPSSGMRFAGDIITSIAHPQQTKNAITGIIQGAIEKLIPGDQEMEKKYLDPMVDFFKERYGSEEGIKKAISEDPVGVLADMSSILAPLGGALKQAGSVSKISKISKAGEVVAKVGGAIDPLSAASKIPGVMAKAIPKNLPSKLYESAVKLSKVIPDKQRTALIKTALDNEIMPTVTGIEKLQERIDIINKNVTDLIDSADQKGKRIPIKDLFNGFDGLLSDAKLSGQPKTAMRAINRIKNEIKSVHTVTIGGEKYLKKLTPSEAQKLKQKIYKENETAYSKITERPASVKAQKQIAKNAKESLEVFFPEIKGLNKNLGELISLKKEIEKAASRIKNRDLIGIGTPIKGIAGGSAGGTKGVIAGLSLGLLDTPLIKTKLSIILNKLQKKGIKINENSGFVTLGLYQPSKLKGEDK